ncbi:hypothetical protein L208DRAFT_1280360, partial [Tricholoma matsutake]
WVPDRYHESILYLGPEEMRGIHHRILEISDMLCFRRRVYGPQVSFFISFFISFFCYYQTLLGTN